MGTVIIIDITSFIVLAYGITELTGTKEKTMPDTLFGDFAIPDDSIYKTKGEYLTAVLAFAKSAAIEKQPDPVDAILRYGIKGSHYDEALKAFAEEPRHYNRWTPS
jgi:hypothetical protein